MGKDPGVLHKENLNTTTTPEDDDTGYYLRLVATEGVSHQEMVGGVVGYAGLPGQQPDGQVDEVLLPVGVCQGVLVDEGGITIRRPRRESETASVSKLGWLWLLLN